MTRARRAALFVLSLGACGDDIAHTDAPLDAVCGGDSPHLLLALDADQRMLASLRAIVPLADRLYYIAGTGQREDPFFDVPTPTATTVYSTGPCGEAPRRIADDVWRVFADDHWPGFILGCRGEALGDLVVLDPAGEAPPRLLAEDGCNAWFTTHGLVRVEASGEDRLRVVFYPTVDDPLAVLEPEVVLDGVSGGWLTTRVRTDEVLALDPGGDLLRVSLPDGEVRVEQPSVHRFDASEDGRYLIWQDGIVTTDSEDEGPAGKIVLRDRIDGSETTLAASARIITTPILHDGFATVWLDSEHPRVVVLPSLKQIDLTGHRFPMWPTADGRVLSQPANGGWLLLDLETGVETTVTDHTGSVRFKDDHLELRHVDPYASWRTEGELWRYPYDDGEPELLARRITGWYTDLPDGRLVTGLDLDDEWIGDLVLIDRHTLAEQKIDERVSGLPAFLNASGAFDQGTLAYAVMDGDRSGVYLTRPTPQ